MGTHRAKRIDTDTAIRDRPIDRRASKRCVNNAIKDWWLQSERYGGKGFEQRMRSLQVDLIRCHVDEMSDEDRRRAIETLAWLEMKQ